MAVFGAILAVVLLNVRINGEITPESIGQFNIGQLFAFYEIDGLCLGKRQFVVAKKSETTDCQWKINKKFEPATIEGKDLPVEDRNGNCYFACVLETGKRPDRVIYDKLKENKVPLSNLDLYTFIACEKADHLKEFQNVFYTFEEFGKLVQYNDLLDYVENTKSRRGLDAIKEKTKVTLSNVEAAINKGKHAKKSEGEIIDGVDDKYEKNAVISYFHQHPLT